MTPEQRGKCLLLDIWIVPSGMGRQWLICKPPRLRLLLLKEDEITLAKFDTIDEAINEYANNRDNYTWG